VQIVGRSSVDRGMEPWLNGALYLNSLSPLLYPSALALYSIKCCKVLSGTAVGKNHQYVDTGLYYMTRRRQEEKEVIALATITSRQSSNGRYLEG
jgi:hypothetical protein